ncbi:peptidylprolyl isomerase [Pararhodobacter sp. CCB-MM2]|uniref:peptidylprolyl isomerase n=1 Tax=Pararhodobacter sp. CCB-MM2 TaxID=1786003 RepID=UPI000834A28B|nr:peptidylprolyl isomerase [Pararhodobacter sp. CCB-MM2]MCA2011507.1 peptidylprolyl isomerase [Cereibacter sphaeroides]
MFKNARFAAATAVFAAFAVPAMAQDASTVLARVGDTEITLGHAIALRSQLPQQFAQVPDETLFPAIVQQLIEQEVIAQSTEGSLTHAQEIMLENETRNFLANAALMDVAQEAVTDESIAAAYEAFAAEYNEGDPVTEYHAAHILVRTEEERDQVVAALAEGREFADVAREFSIDGSAQQGGDLGWFPAGVMIPDFQAAVEALEPGQVSEPVQTRFGWHVIQLQEIRDASAPALADVREELVAEIQREATRTYIDGLSANTTVEDLSEGVDVNLLSDMTLLDE